MKKFISIILILTMLTTVCHPVAADTPTITIVGGSVAGGGLAGGNNAKSDVAAVIASLIMASQDIKVHTVEGTPIDFVKDVLRDYADFLGYSFQTLCDLWTSNVKILANGILDLGINNLTYAKNFLLYLKNGNKLYTPQGFSEYVYVGGVACPVVSYGQIIDIFVDLQNDIYGYKNLSQSKFIIFWTDQYNPKTVYFVSKTSPFHLQMTLNGNDFLTASEFSGSQQPTNHLYVYTVRKGSANTFLIPYVPNGDDAVKSLLSDFEIEENNPDDNELIGDPSDVNPDDLDTNNLISPGIDLSALASAFGVDGTVSISDYIDAITNAINGVSDNVLKVYDSVTGLYDEIPLTDYDVYDSTTSSSDNNVSGGQDIIDDTQLPSAEESEHYLTNMQFNLTGIFPFCIPFDVVNLVSKLDVSPVTPYIDLDFPLPFSEEPLNLVLDFSQWDDVAAVFRKMELFAFVVGLALITRNIIRG